MQNVQSNKDRRIFFPWEGRGPLRRFFVRGRFVTILSVALLVTVVSWIVARERKEAGVRRSLVALSHVRPMVERYLFDNDGNCPSDMDKVRQHVGAQSLPVDGWGRPLRLVCPSSRPGHSYVLMSDGPDGLPGGLDRVED